MTIRTTTAGAYLVHDGRIINALPGTMLGWSGYPNSNTSQFGVTQAHHTGDSALLHWMQDNGSSKHVSTRYLGDSDGATSTVLPDANSSATLAYQFGSHAAGGASRKQYWAANPVINSSTSVGGDPAAISTKTCIGAWLRLGINNNPAPIGQQHADYSWYDRELTGGESDNVRTGGVLPESLSGWLDTLQLTTFDPGCTFTGSISGTTLTVASGLTGTVVQGRLLTGTGISADTIVGTQISGTTGGIGTYNVSVSQTASSTSITGGGVYTSMNGRIFTAYGSWTGTGVDAHPVTRTAPAILTGNITAADAAPTGALGQLISSVTTLPASRNPGNGARLASIANVAVAVLADDANLSRLAGSAGLNMGSDGRVTFANGVPVPPGTSVAVVTRLPGANGALGIERYITF